LGVEEDTLFDSARKSLIFGELNTLIARRGMKPTALALVSVTALLFSVVGSASAGTLTLDEGPSFRPGSSFTDNDIAAVLLHNPPGDVVRLFGDSLVAPDGDSPRIVVKGSFSAGAGDLFSVIYDFTVDLRSPTPVNLTLAAQTFVAGKKQTFDALITLSPGVQHYQGQIDGPLFNLATSGLWRGRLLFDFPASGSGGANPDATDLSIQIASVDYQLAAIPEPSSLLFLAIGIVALPVLARRRRRIV
jgi:hypothetical protein